MAFDWMSAKVSVAGRKAQAGKRALMIRAELEERAALLFRLRYPKNRARARLRANLRWDFEVGAGQPPSDAELDEIVDRVYGRGARRGD